MNSNKLITICGPTCSGKTSLAIKLCNEFNGETVSADSRQVYKYMDIGTGKLPLKYQISKSLPSRQAGKCQNIEDNYNTDSLWCVEGVNVHGYDLVEPNERFSAGDFKEYAQNKFQELWGQAKLPFLVGGTGFYISAALGEIELSGVPANPELRKKLNNLETEELTEILEELDQNRLKEIDKNNPRRLIRAIEIAIADKQEKQSSTRKQKDNLQRSGLQGSPLRRCVSEVARLIRNLNKRPRDEPRTKNNILVLLKRARRRLRRRGFQKADHIKSEPRLNSLKIGLKAPRRILYQRADNWAEEVVEQGLVEEVKTLIEMGYKNTKPMQGLIYLTVVEYLEGKKTKQEMLQRIKWDLHKYIRRQLTWFERDKDINWLDISKPGFDTKAITLVESYLEK